MNESIEFRKAGPEDLPRIVELFKSAIQIMDNAGIHQWNFGDYPNEEVLREDVEKGQMYLGMIGNEVASVFVLNRECDGQYRNGKWKYSASPFAVVHRLCVNPSFQNMGVGRKTMDHIEATFRQSGIECVRLDAYSLNPYALRLYEGRGFEAVGEAYWKNRIFYLFEKKL